MPPQEMECATLGQKHRDYNALLKELISTGTVPDTKSDNSDINNLLRIDIASHNKDVQYILEIFKGDDMLYVSKALSSCLWLITDQQYANIINPDYLQTELYPNMTTKAFLKLKKHIRHNIKDEARAELFYLSEKTNSGALKWLPYCSIEFIEKNVERHITKSYKNPMTLHLFKRLCEKSITVLDIILKKIVQYDRQRYLQVVTFILKTDVGKYLDVLESNDNNYGHPKLNGKATDLIMKHSPTRIIDKMEQYVTTIDLPTFVKYLPANEIKDFLYSQAKKDLNSVQFSSLRKLFDCDTMKYFIKRLPKNEQFDFAKTIGLQEVPSDAVAYRVNKLCYTANRYSYVWYQFAPFEQAFAEITKMITLTENDNEKLSMFTLLIRSANKNLQHIQAIVKYFLHKQRCEEISFKCHFTKDILKYTQISKYDKDTWNIIYELFKLTSDEKSFNQDIISAIIIYKVLNGEKIHEALDNLSFNTLKPYKAKMNQEQQNKIFTYLYEYSLTTIKEPITDERKFALTINTIKDILKLFQDWEMSFVDYPDILNKIKELIKLKKENSWKTSMSSLYNVNKSWRKHMFEESVDLCPSEEVCLNALKHDPQLLARHSGEVNALRTNKIFSLRRLLNKLRIYWPESLAQQWIETYLDTINDTQIQKAVITGLCALLPQKQLLDMIEKYVPENPKINWKEIDNRFVNVQRYLAVNMHHARPQPSPEAILPYAKGDYLQFALPSLLAIFYNLKPPIKCQFIPKLLDAPVSLQKHGIRLAFKSMNPKELKQVLLNSWTKSKNSSIRTITFKFTFTLLCSRNEPADAIDLWELLESFIDNLTFKEDKTTYELLSQVEKVPINVRAKFLVKSYNFLKKLIPTVDGHTKDVYNSYCEQLAEHARIVMGTICQDFVYNLIQEFIENTFFNFNQTHRIVHHSSGLVRVISAYLLHATDENDQILKYENLMVPIMQRSLENWNEKRNGKYIVKENFLELLTCLIFDLKDYVSKKKTLTPVKMFTLIQSELEKSLPVPENYSILTRWKLAVALVQLTEQYAIVDKEWDTEYGLKFGKICLEHLKTDVSLHFPCIYVLFSRSVRYILPDVLPNNALLEFYEGILSDTDYIPGYLSCIEIGADSRNDDKYKPIWDKVFANPSVEVKMHYYNKIHKQI